MIYDGSITYVLYSLRKQFGFDVVRIKLGGVDCVSKIIIKAHSSQKDEIFKNFAINCRDVFTTQHYDKLGGI